jgi:mannonate dehydratase
MEGGTMTGKDVVGMIEYFGRMKKLFKIHFRNVSAPLPHFTETMIDDGYYDMSNVMQALVDIDFDGIVIPDHIRRWVSYLVRTPELAAEVEELPDSSGPASVWRI